jgi:hypothetical protein
MEGPAPSVILAGSGVPILQGAPSGQTESQAMRSQRIRTLLLTLTALALLASPGIAQEPADTLRQQFRIPLPPTTELLVRGSSISPGISVSNPTGFGARYGDAFVGVGYQHRTRIFTRADGGAAAGLGIGNPQSLIGLEVVATTFGTVRTCCRGGVHFKAHRVLPWNSSVAVGWENAILWNDREDRPATDAGRSLYAAATKVFFVRPDGVYPFSTVTVTAGAGNGRFRRERDIVEDRSTINPFGSVAARLSERTALIADWTGHDLAAGMSIVPFRDRPFFVTPGVADLTTRPRFILGAGYGFNYTGALF